jgi:hypothetical protein
MGGKRNVSKILIEKPEENGPLERSIHRWEENIKVDLGKITCEDVDWIHLGQDLMNTVINSWVPLKIWNFLISWATISFSRRDLLYEVTRRDVVIILLFINTLLLCPLDLRVHTSNRIITIIWLTLHKYNII